MSSLKYVGRYPDQDRSVVTRQYVLDRKTSSGVSPEQVDAEMDTRLADKVLKTYVDSQDATLATKTYVDQQDAKYLLASQLGVANGVAKLNASGTVDAAQLAGISRAPQVVFKGSGWTNPDYVALATATLGSITIPDPGYQWTPWVYGSGFESYAATNGGSGRPDLQLRGSLGGTTRTIGYGTGALGDVNLNPIPIATSGSHKINGGGSVTLTCFRGYGDTGFYVYANYGFITIVCMPIA